MMWAMIAINRPADSVDGEHGRVKTTGRMTRCGVDGEHGRVKTTSLQHNAGSSSRGETR